MDLKERIDQQELTVIDAERFAPLVESVGDGLAQAIRGPLPTSCTVVHSIHDALRFSSDTDWSDVDFDDTPSKPIGTLTLGPAAPKRATKQKWKTLTDTEDARLQSVKAWDKQYPGMGTEAVLDVSLLNSAIRTVMRESLDRPFLPTSLKGISEEFLRTRCMLLVLTYLALGKPASPLSTDILAVWKAGGLPCGWRGKYPAGGIVAYWPWPQAPTFSTD